MKDTFKVQVNVNEIPINHDESQFKGEIIITYKGKNISHWQNPTVFNDRELCKKETEKHVKTYTDDAEKYIAGLNAPRT